MILVLLLFISILFGFQYFICFGYVIVTSTAFTSMASTQVVVVDWSLHLSVVFQEFYICTVYIVCRLVVICYVNAKCWQRVGSFETCYSFSSYLCPAYVSLLMSYAITGQNAQLQLEDIVNHTGWHVHTSLNRWGVRRVRGRITFCFVFFSLTLNRRA